MDDLDPVDETNEAPPEDEEEEANLDISIPVPAGFNPDIGAAPDVGRDIGVMRMAFVHDKKNFLSEALKVNLNKGDGPSSTTLYDNLLLTRGQRIRKNNGAKFRG